jgi:hypothetical protein
MEESRSRSLETDASVPDISSLFSFWPEPEPPLEEEVRLALVAAFPDLEQLDELETSDEVLWGVTWRVPEGQDAAGEYIVWVEPRVELSDDYLRESLGPGAEYVAARASRWFIGVETQLDTTRAQASFQGHLRFLSHATVPGLVAVYDENALIVRSGRHVEDLCACPVPPRPRNLYAIHPVSGKGGMWVHTHGLSRAGLPELDLLGIREEAEEGARELIHAVVDALLADVEPDSHGCVEVGEGLAVRLVGLADALPLFAPDHAGGSQDREGDGAPEHGGRRLVILDAAADRPPWSQLSHVARRAGALYKSRGETDRQRTLSLGRWGTFGQLFVLRRDTDGFTFHVKMAYERQRFPRDREHLWFEVLDLKPGSVRARLMNEPLDVPDLRVGQELWLPLDRLTDWLIVTPDGDFDPESAPVLLDGLA